MSTFLNYLLPGIPNGCDFALTAVGLVITFRTTGVFNLAFGGQAFAAAFVFDLLVRSQGLPVWAAFVVSVLVISPGIGLLLDRYLFRHIATTNTTAKMVSAVGLMIAIPEMLPILFGTANRLNPPYLWLNPNVIEFHLFSTPVNGAEVTTVVITVVVVATVVALLRLTPIGLEMRAVVESRRLAQLQGVDAGRVAASAWALSSLVAGLAGVLLLPQIAQLQPTDPLQFTTLLVAGLTAAAVARMRSITGALAAAVGLGVAESLLAGYLPSGSISQAFVEVFPFVVLVGTLVRSKTLRVIERRADPMAGVDPPPPPPAVSIRDRRLDAPMRWGFRILIVAFLVSAVTWVPDYWLDNPLSLSLVLSTMFLSITLITGGAGQLSLCQAAFAGIGAFATGQLAAHLGLSVLLGVVVGGLMAAVVGALLALLAVRISGLILALLTLAFALFADQFLFQYSWSGGGASGLSVPRPVLGPVNFSSDRSFLVLAFVVLVLCIGLVKLVQLGTTGRFLAAMRGSEAGAASLGINLTRARVTVFALSAGIAGVGGAMYAMTFQGASADNFVYELSLAYVVVVITTGSRRIEGAVQAGFGFAVMTYLLATYAPTRFSGLVPVLFAFGAMTYAAHPEGIVEYQKRRWLERVSRLLAKLDARRDSGAPVVVPPDVVVPSAESALPGYASGGTIGLQGEFASGGVVGLAGDFAPGGPVGLPGDAVAPNG
ncbi:MAG TPA: ABC transporter permease [Acidimicrobiales bacterium]|nr:ABC transporter permease [Acidimicrobiales bacterium]